MTLSEHIRSIGRLFYEHPSAAEAEVRVARSETDTEGRPPKLSYYPATKDHAAVVIIDPECEQCETGIKHRHLEGTGPTGLV